MIYRADGRKKTADAVGDDAIDPPAGLNCRVVQVALTLYLMPVILVVLCVGGTAVVSANLARVAGRIIPGHSMKSSGPVLSNKTTKHRHRTHLATRTGRSRVL